MRVSRGIAVLSFIAVSGVCFTAVGDVSAQGSLINTTRSNIKNKGVKLVDSSGEHVVASGVTDDAGVVQFSNIAPGMYQYSVTADGKPVEMELVSPRDAASGQATGKRQHAPVTANSATAVTQCPVAIGSTDAVVTFTVTRDKVSVVVRSEIGIVNQGFPKGK